MYTWVFNFSPSLFLSHLLPISFTLLLPPLSLYLPPPSLSLSLFFLLLLLLLHLSLSQSLRLYLLGEEALVSDP